MQIKCCYASARRPAPVICNRTTSIDRPPARTDSGAALAKPSRTNWASISILKAVRQHDRLGAAARAAGKQFERSSLVRVSRRHARGARGSLMRYAGLCADGVAHPKSAFDGRHLRPFGSTGWASRVGSGSRSFLARPCHTHCRHRQHRERPMCQFRKGRTILHHDIDKLLGGDAHRDGRA